MVLDGRRVQLDILLDHQWSEGKKLVPWLCQRRPAERLLCALDEHLRLREAALLGDEDREVTHRARRTGKHVATPALLFGEKPLLLAPGNLAADHDEPALPTGPPAAADAVDVHARLVGSIEKGGPLRDPGTDALRQEVYPDLRGRLRRRRWR
jgi:hypothetical protein